MVTIPPNVVCLLCDVRMDACPFFDSGFLVLLSVDDCRFDVHEVSYSCKESVGKYSNVEIVVTVVVVIGSAGERVGSIFCSRVVFD